MAKNKWFKQLSQYEDAVKYDYDSYAPENCLYTPSPYFNWIFANKSHGIPKNASLLMFSEPKAGKSLAVYAMIMEMQKRDPEGIAVVFNTEIRGQLQHDVFPDIDRERMVIFDTNNPIEIFDRVENDIKVMVQDGMPLRMIAIDSLTNIQGIKREDAASVANHLIGDHAITVQTGLSKLVPFCKRNGILLVATEQVRANIDGGYGGPKEKAASTWATKHAFEYHISFKKANSKDDKQDIEGKTFEDEGIKDARDNKLVLGHKVYVKMESSSIGQSGRAGVFTLSYKKGIINQNEEIFWLGKNTGIISTPNNRTYNFGGQSFNGKKECAAAIRDNSEMASAILEEVKKLDNK